MTVDEDAAVFVAASASWQLMNNGYSVGCRWINSAELVDALKHDWIDEVRATIFVLCLLLHSNRVIRQSSNIRQQYGICIDLICESFGIHHGFWEEYTLPTAIYILCRVGRIWLHKRVVCLQTTSTIISQYDASHLSCRRSKFSRWLVFGGNRDGII